MANESDDRIDEDSILNDLVKAAREDSREGFIRPSKVSIEAYLLGTATETQKKEVTRALIQSAEFRRELLDMAKDLESLADVETIDEFNKVQAPAAPSLESLVNRAGQQTIVRKHAAPSKLAQSLRSFLEFFIGRRWPRLATVGLVGAALIAFVSLRIVQVARDTPDELPIVTWNAVAVMDAGLLVSNITRVPGSELAEVTLYPTHREAAEAEFARLIRYENGEYTLKSEARKVAPPDPAKRVFLRFVDESANTLKEFYATIPGGRHGVFSSVLAWSIAIPSRQLRNFELSSDSVVVVWTPEMGLRGCVTFTYELDGKYTASPGLSFGF